MNDRVYIHEFIHINGHHRADYLHHMAANWSPHAQETRNQQLYGIWSVLGSTGPWPQVVNMWEEDGFAGLARSFGAEAVGPGAQDPTLAAWWAEAATFRSGGFDRLLKPAPWTPIIADQCAVAASDTAGAGGVAYAHELIRVRPGANWELLGLAREVAEPAYAAFGLDLLGGFVTTMVDDDECLLLWSIPSWEAWAAFEDAHLPDDVTGRARPPDDRATLLGEWRRRSAEIVTARHRILLVDGPLSPFRTGRQPSAADQRPELR